MSKALSNTQILRAALVVLLGFLASGVLGLVRTAVFSATFGASAELDAFYAAQRIPELLFNLVAGGALGSSFIPVFSRFLSDEDDQQAAWRLASATMTFSAGAALILSLLLILLAPILVPTLLVPGASNYHQALTVSLTQLMLVTTIIFSVSGLLMGILNAHQKFLLPALALSMNNVGLIIGALFITRWLPPQLIVATGVFEHLHADMQPMLLWSAEDVLSVNVFGLAFGAILGAMLHLAVQLPGLFSIRARLRPLLNWNVEGVKEVLLLMGPRVLGLAVVQINFAVNVAFASTMIPGSLVALNTAWYLMFFTLGIIGQSVGTAVFPSLSALVAENNMDGYRNRLSRAMRGILFLALPATVGLIVIGSPVIALLFERGEWTAEDTQATAWALTFFALGMAGHGLLEVLSRAFYALADTWTPVQIGIAAMVMNIILSILLIQVIGDPGSLARGPFAGLALANSATTLVEAGVLWLLLNRRINGVEDRYVIDGIFRTAVAALVMGTVIMMYLQFAEDSTLLIRTGGGVLLGLGSFSVLAVLLRIEEVTVLLRRFKLLR